VVVPLSVLVVVPLSVLEVLSIVIFPFLVAVYVVFPESIVLTVIVGLLGLPFITFLSCFPITLLA
jgi:hypothetical protein